ncbi:MAG: hypothetical protein JNK45_26125 [Myxococcales bacterium]|nr:hypothetical protein [Myxococcales bacterium]
MLAASVFGGCSTSDATADGLSDGGSTSDSLGDPEATTAATAGADGADDSSGDGAATSPGATEGEGGTAADSDGVGCELDCGDGGECAFDEDGAPRCECFDGYANNGATCVACVEAPDGVDLAMSRVRLRVTINGATPPASPLEYGEIRLRHRDTADVVVLGDTRTPELEASVLAGRYDVYFSRKVGSAVVPANANVRIGTIDAIDGIDQTIDIPVVTLSGAFSFDGAAAPKSPTENGRVWLRNAATADQILLGTTNSGSYSVLVTPGDYTLSYEGITGAEIAPANHRGAFGAVTIDAEDSTLDVDIPTVRLSGDFSFDGLAAPDSATEYGRITLQTGDDAIDLGETRAGSYEVRVLPGSYDVVYEAILGAEIAPANQRAVVSTIVTGVGATVKNIDIATVLVEGALTFNGEPAPNDPTDDGYILLRHANGDEVLLGMTSAGAYSRRVMVGAYEVYYVQDSSREAAPRNTNARIQEFIADAGGSVDIDVARVEVSGTILLAGQTPPDSDYQDGHLFLRDMMTGDSVLLGNTRAGAFSAPVVPGVYEVVYVAETAGAPLPVNTGAVIGDVVIDEGVPFDLPIDVPALSLAGAVTINGAAAPMDTLDVGSLYLVDAQTRDQIYLGSTYDGAYAQTLTPGSYLLYYRVSASSGAVPANADANLGCWTLK